MAGIESSKMAPPVPRRPLHRRVVDCTAYLREDGLWEVEARLRDTKTFPFIHFARGPLEAGAAVHDIALRLTVDDDSTIVAVDAEMDTTPMLGCQDVLPGMKALLGIRILVGWRKEVRKRIERLHACTHLMDLMVPAITTLYQTMGMGKDPEGRNAVADARAAGIRPFYLDECYSWRADGPGVREFLPEFAMQETQKD
jgi:hypothetical protein